MTSDKHTIALMSANIYERTMEAYRDQFRAYDKKHKITDRGQKLGELVTKMDLGCKDAAVREFAAELAKTQVPPRAETSPPTERIDAVPWTAIAFKLVDTDEGSPGGYETAIIIGVAEDRDPVYISGSDSVLDVGRILMGSDRLPTLAEIKKPMMSALPILRSLFQQALGMGFTMADKDVDKTELKIHVVGPTRSGKTTVATAIADLLRQHGVTVEVVDEDYPPRNPALTDQTMNHFAGQLEVTITTHQINQEGKTDG